MDDSVFTSAKKEKLPDILCQPTESNKCMQLPVKRSCSKLEPESDHVSRSGDHCTGNVGGIEMC